MVHARPQWTSDLTALRDGDPMWNFPLTFPDVVNPALGSGKPNLIFAVMEGDLFVAGRPQADIDRVCTTLVQSRHIGLLCTKYTPQMAAYFTALDPPSVSHWQSKLWLCFGAENQECFDRRWADIRPLAEAGWFVFTSLAPLIAPVTLPQDFLELGKSVVVNGECEQIEPELCRPMDADWARSPRNQCAEAGMPFFMRNMHSGSYVPLDLHIREFPVV